LMKDQSGWLMGGFGTIYHAESTDSNWVPVLEIGDISQFNPVTGSVAFVSSNMLGELLKTMDGGKTWTRISIEGIIVSHNYRYFYSYFVDPQHGWLASNGSIFRTADGGLIWDQIMPKMNR